MSGRREMMADDVAPGGSETRCEVHPSARERRTAVGVAVVLGRQWEEGAGLGQERKQASQAETR